MQKLLLILILALLLSAGCSRPTPSQTWYRNISTGEAAKMVSSNKDIVIVDVREVSEYSGRQGHVPGAVNYPWISGIFKDNFQKLDKGKEILLVCRSGRRSQAAATFLCSKGYPKVYNMLGGTNQWIKDGHNTEQSSK